MDQFGRAVSRAFDDMAFTIGHMGATIGSLLGDAIVSVDQSIHQVVPAAIPSWVLLGAVILLAAWFLFRR